MEYLEGRDLGAIVEERGAFPAEEAVGYVLQACEAIAEAHAAKIVHRDLKPANLFLAQRADKRSIVKVLDFGISKSTGKGEDVSLTRTSSVMGSPLYMSPEQMASAKMVDQRSDIWALGVILYELVTGVPPFVAESMTEVIASILMHQPAPPSGVTVSPGLTMVINKCLEKEPAKRYQNVGELVVALAPFGPASQRGTVERVIRVLGGSVKPEPMASSPQIDVPPTQPLPARASVGPASMQGASADAINKLAVAKTHASWGRTDEPVVAGSGRGKLLGAAAAVGVIAIVGGVLAFRRPEVPPVAAVPSAPSVPAAVASVPEPGSAPTPSSTAVQAPAAPAFAGTASNAASPAPPDTSPKAPRQAPAPRASAARPARAAGSPPQPAPAAPAPAPTATAKNPLQIDLK
jgi:serine/threonine-protein kinase